MFFLKDIKIKESSYFYELYKVQKDQMGFKKFQKFQKL